MSYKVNIFEEATANENFRKVMNTGDKSQLVIMDIKTGESIGKEIHENVEQTLFIMSGEGTAVLDDVEFGVEAGDAVVVSPGTEHDFINDGDEPMKIFTVYTPPNHIDGTIHETKADAEADVKDEEFGNQVESGEEYLLGAVLEDDEDDPDKKDDEDEDDSDLLDY